MRLRSALRIQPGQSIAFIGAGGKSSAIRVLAKELHPHYPVLCTTSTKLGLDQDDLADHHVIFESSDQLDEVSRRMRSGSILVTGAEELGEPKWSGLSLTELIPLRDLGREAGGILLIEADGARMKSLKAPGEHEPVVPDWVDQVVSIAGLDVIGKPFTQEYCHRAERAMNLLGIDGEVKIEMAYLSRLLRSPKGGLKGAPPSAVVRVLLRTVRGEDLETGRTISNDVLSSKRIRSAIIGSLDFPAPVSESISRTAGIILAAGASTRLDGSKQFLPFKGMPLIRHSVEAARSGGLDPIIIVVGEDEDLIREALGDDRLEFVRNPNPDRGQGSSLRVGVEGIDPEVETIVILLADMPLISDELIQELIEKHRRTLSPIVVPYANGKRGNPVLFDRITFDALKKVEGDRGGRAIFSQFPHERVDWDSSIHFDVDTKSDVERLRDLEG